MDAYRLAAREEKKRLLRILRLRPTGLSDPLLTSLREVIRKSLHGKAAFRIQSFAASRGVSSATARYHMHRLAELGWINLSPPRAGRPISDLKAARWHVEINDRMIEDCDNE